MDTSGTRLSPRVLSPSSMSNVDAAAAAASDYKASGQASSECECETAVEVPSRANFNGNVVRLYRTDVVKAGQLA